MRFIEYLLDKIEKEKKLVLHTKIINSDAMNYLERALLSRNPSQMAWFYNNLPTMLNEDGFNLLLEQYNKREFKYLSSDDIKIIEFISKYSDKNFTKIIDISGTLIYVCEVLEEIEDKREHLSKTLLVSIILWAYLNLHELVNRLMTYDLKYIIENTQLLDEKRKYELIKEINSKIYKGKHLESGRILDLLSKMKVIDKINRNVLYEIKEFRNKIGHANLYYDDELEKIILSNGEMWKYEEFKAHFEKLYEFVLKWLYVSNNNNENIKSTLINLFRRLKEIFKRIERGPIYKEKYNHLVLSWVKEWKQNKS